ncbi:MAG TPA: hypothetical protein VKB78_15445 [Pirellulales bacterium]|nr:hypothetical protein [Pirellulales bacterium]
MGKCRFAVAIAALGILVGCGKAEKPAVQAPDHFVPLPNHPPAALASPKAAAPPTTSKDGGSNERLKDHSSAERPSG